MRWGKRCGVFAVFAVVGLELMLAFVCSVCDSGLVVSWGIWDTCEGPAHRTWLGYAVLAVTGCCG